MPAFTQFNYPGTYESQDFHYCGLEPNNIIVNYDNALEVQTCELDGLAEYVNLSQSRFTLSIPYKTHFI